MRSFLCCLLVSRFVKPQHQRKVAFGAVLLFVVALFYLLPTIYHSVSTLLSDGSYKNERDSDFVYWYLTSLPNASHLPEVWNYTAAHSKLYRQAALKHFFRSQLSPVERKNLISLLRTCLVIVENVGLQNMLYSGTLIGYHRHNASLIPWDDDCDVALIPESSGQIPHYLEKLKKQLANHVDVDLVYVENQRRLKCFSKNENVSTAIAGYQWRWPFIDLQFMNTYVNKKLFFPASSQENIVEDASVASFHFLADWIFPLKKAHFTEDRILVYVPRNITAVLASNFNITQCRSPDYSHRLETYSSHFVTVDCSELKPFTVLTNV